MTKAELERLLGSKLPKSLHLCAHLMCALPHLGQKGSKGMGEQGWLPQHLAQKLLSICTAMQKGCKKSASAPPRL